MVRGGYPPPHVPHPKKACGIWIVLLPGHIDTPFVPRDLEGVQKFQEIMVKSVGMSHTTCFFGCGSWGGGAPPLYYHHVFKLTNKLLQKL